MFKITKGLDIPIAGEPIQDISTDKITRQQAIILFDYNGLKPSVLVEVGDYVSEGQAVISDKQDPKIQITSPTSGVISAINRGERRILQSIVIDTNVEKLLPPIVFNTFSEGELNSENVESIRQQLQSSGLWAAFRTRPFSRIPHTQSTPHSIFVNCMDTRPLAINPIMIVNQYVDDFIFGLKVISFLAPINLCKQANSKLQLPDISGLQQHEFDGPHPAGLPGTHIHFISPVSTNRTVWTINYQDVIAIGKLFSTGQIWNHRVISLAGPVVKDPRAIRVPIGADITELVLGELKESKVAVRNISGSILGGRTAKNAFAYLGRYHLQVSCIEEASSPELFDYIRPTGERFSAMNLFFTKIFKRKLNLTTNTEGEPRNMVPFGNYELVMPLDILPTQLLRSLIIGDTEMAQQLGCLELDEEDLALCSYVCAGKYEYGPILRAQLARIEVEG